MGRSAGDRASIAARQAAIKPDTFKPSQPGRHRHAKSQPFDADDLRRRLYVVIAEQEASKKKRRSRHEAESGSARDTSTNRSGTPKSVATKPGADETSFAARMARGQTPGDLLLKDGSVLPPEGKLGRSVSKSIQDKLRRRASRIEPILAEDVIKAPTYHHIPQQAAAQFERTATANSMREGNLVHSLSQSALKYHTEGRQCDRTELESSMSPAQQNRALERARSHREKVHERNQFQSPRQLADERRSSEESRRNIIIGLSPIKSRGKNSIGNIPEDEALAVHPVAPLDPPVDEIASEETLVVDPMVVREHRVDWTQSDEPYSRPKTAVRIPLLRKADSLWTLKGKLVHLSKNSYSMDEKMGAIREKHDDGLTSPSKNKSLRLGFLAKFRR
ncbi:hypothetical protein GGS26DRAFT_592958 [Hypomontagnella submonticulosa]|nr:hypothetical protein GGS26DRAFT_592958 [Hypomontagnella submonticulosa]